MNRLLGIILLCEVMTLAVDASAQSIADLARQERDRKKTVANKTYTNADVGEAAVTGQPSQPSAVAPTADAPQGVTTVTTAGTAAAGTSAAGVPAKPSGPTDNKGRDEKYWRDQFAAARNSLKRAEDQSRVLEAKLAELNTQMLRQSDLYNRAGRLQADINGANTQIATARQDADKARQQIPALEEELRRSAGPAGWAR